ncbi:MAG: TetR/AcrR family transcriptional regulator [Actinomycetota bacterium]|nr:TetR/AcrR family transcriptional regulator [Actinomycetota bacterium]
MSSSTGSTDPPRRQVQRRRETVQDIKAAARAQLDRAGPEGISLRGIARELGMAASAVHYYFPSRGALLDSLIGDGFDSLAQALRRQYEQDAGRGPDERWLNVCRAHRGWALARPSEYLLLYGHTGGATRRAHPKVAQAMAQVAAVLVAMMRDAVAHGAVDTDRIAATVPTSLRPQLAAWRESTDALADLPDGAVAACMLGFAELHGAITLELIGHTPPQITDHDALFDLRMSHIASSLHPPEMTRQPHTIP